jgi:hypothetical protein
LKWYFCANFKKYNSLFSLNFQNGNYNFIRKEVSLQADRRRGAKLIKSSAIYGMINPDIPQIPQKCKETFDVATFNDLRLKDCRNPF